MGRNRFDAEELARRNPQLLECQASLIEAADALFRTVSARGRIYTFGNGGSSADAEHIVGELLKPFVRDRPLDRALRRRLAQIDSDNGTALAIGLKSGIAACALTGPASILTAISNDMAPSLVFAQQIVAMVRPGDLCIAISTSGDSENVVHGALTAHAVGGVVVALTGRSGGVLGRIADITIAVPADSADQVQELHIVAYHWLCGNLEARLYPSAEDI